MLWGSAALAWLGMLCFGAVMLLVAIKAGRSSHDWQRVPLLLLELVFGGAALVSWMFEVWFAAKIFMAMGMAASEALLLGIAWGIVMLVLAAAICVFIVRVGYSVLGRSDRFRSDLGNSLWLSRSQTFRPDDF
jgi:hypothetical protein